tara:strand:- start:481 stop:1122 length:642 start_codon:yes stop_codon:yes gene_type:complete
MGLLLYYPTPVYEKDDAMSEDFNQGLEKKIIDYSKSNEEAKNWSKQFYGDGFTSYGSDQRLHEKEEIFSELAKGLLPHVKEFLTHIKAIPPTTIKCYDMWCTINRPKTGHPRHIHPLSAVSGTYYVNADKDRGCLNIHDPYDNRAMGIMFEPDSPLALDTYTLEVKSKKVILFPGWVSHSVQQNSSNKDRIGVSFNYRVFYDNPGAGAPVLIP